MRVTWVALALFAFLAATNRYYFVATDGDLIEARGKDTWSYLAIAQAAPGIPENPLPYHHAQRFILPFMVGLIGAWTGFPVEWIMRGFLLILLLAAVVLTDRFAIRLGFFPGMRLALSGMIFLNPYLTRLPLSMPFMGNDFVFVAGTILFLIGLHDRSPARMLAGAIVSIACRQTAILFLFPLLAFILLEARAGRNSIRLNVAAAACAAVVVAGFFLTGIFASLAGEPSVNLTTITYLFVWMKSHFDFHDLIVFLGRGIGAFLVPAAGLAVLAVRLPRVPQGSRAEDHSRNVAFVFLLTGFLIVLQPILGGPIYGMLHRLGVLGLWALVFGFALLFPSDTAGSWRRVYRFLPILLMVLALHSLHPYFAWPAKKLFGERPALFMGLQVVLAAGLVLGLRGNRERRSGGDPGNALPAYPVPPPGQ